MVGGCLGIFLVHHMKLCGACLLPASLLLAPRWVLGWTGLLWLLDGRECWIPLPFVSA